MQNRMKRMLWLLVMLVVCSLYSVAFAEGISPFHKVTNTYVDTETENKSSVRLWHVNTALESVTVEVNGIADQWANEIVSNLPVAKNNKKLRSHVDVEIRYSRTGHRWLSFLIQARVQDHKELIMQVFTTRTYDMETGERIHMKDIFGKDEVAWQKLSEGVREALTAYWPEIEPDKTKLDALCSRASLEQADFTLHGMSLVLHYPADSLYEGKKTLINVPFFYPEIRNMMTDEALVETDNLSYYKTCALTFDDGPSGVNTPKVLDSLMETGATATFFVIGNRVMDYAFLVQREHDEGHAVASHNWHHGNVTKSTTAALQAMPAKVNKVMIDVIGIPPRYDRVPGGRYPAMVKAKVGWSYIQWSLDTYDWRGISSKEVMRKIRKRLTDGDIILCHDIKKNTPESTRQIVRYLEEQGYMLLTIDELFAKDGVVLQPNTVYYRCVDGYTGKRPKP